MNPMSRFLSIGISTALIILIFYLVKKGKLKEKYAIIWILVGITILIFAIFDKILILVATFFGIKTPINAMFFLGIFFIITISLNLSLIVSSLMEQNKKIIQKIALIEAELTNLSKK